MITEDRPIEHSQDHKYKNDQPKKLRVKIFVFLVCLAISGSMWIFIELMKDYTTDIPFLVTFVNVPKDLILEDQTDSTIVAGINAQGFELLFAQYLKKRQSIEIDLSDVMIRQGADGYTAFIPAPRVIQQIARQINYSKSILYIKPDTLFFRFSEVYKKRVPVQLDLSCTFADQFQMSDSVRFSPSTVLVSSIKNVIDTIRSVRTQHIELNNLDSSRVVKVPLMKSLRGNMIRYSPDSITVKVEVGRYTEAVFTKTVSILGNSLPIRIFPAQVEITCQVPLSEYKEINADDFIVEVLATPETLATNKRLSVVLAKSPSNVHSVRIKPDQVEYIIIAK